MEIVITASLREKQKEVSGLWLKIWLQKQFFYVQLTYHRTQNSQLHATSPISGDAKTWTKDGFYFAKKHSCLLSKP